MKTPKVYDPTIEEILFEEELHKLNDNICHNYAQHRRWLDYPKGWTGCNKEKNHDGHCSYDENI